VGRSGSDSGDCSVTACRHIAYAVNQAVSGDTVSVAAGNYVESQVSIVRPMTVQGAGVGQSIVSQDPSNNAGTTDPGLFRIVTPQTGNIKIEGFTLTGANRQNTFDEPFLLFADGIPPGGQL